MLARVVVLSDLSLTTPPPNVPVANAHNVAHPTKRPAAHVATNALRLITTQRGVLRREYAVFDANLKGCLKTRATLGEPLHPGSQSRGRGLGEVQHTALERL